MQFKAPSDHITAPLPQSHALCVGADRPVGPEGWRRDISRGQARPHRVTTGALVQCTGVLVQCIGVLVQ